MTRIRQLAVRGGLLAAGAVAVFGCDQQPPTAAAPTAPVALHSRPDRARGGGTYDLAGLIVRFGFVAVQHGNGRATGAFRHKTSYDGLTADFSGRVTCLAVDEVNGRAWIGGVITRNRSTDPDYAAEIFQPGHDIWFRVLDTGRHSPDPDRTTFVGFEGAAGLATSAEYCAARIWPDGNLRTWPVTGKVVVGH